MASFQIRCPNCDTMIMMQEEWLGMEMECPACHNQFTVSGNSPAETLPQMPSSLPPMPPQGMGMPQQPGMMPPQNYYGGNMPAPAAPGGRFCTNCGSPIAYQAAICLRCGCPPDQARNFCASCGSPVSYQAVICLRCGSSLNHSGSSAVGGRKDKVVAGLLAIFLGHLGIHMFYLGNNNSAVTRLLITLLGSLFFGLGWFVMAIISFIEGIMYFTMDDATFQEKYVVRKQGWF